MSARSSGVKGTYIEKVKGYFEVPVRIEACRDLYIIVIVTGPESKNLSSASILVLKAEHNLSTLDYALVFYQQSMLIPFLDHRASIV